MYTILRWTSIALFALLSAFFIWFGAVYASVKEPLWFHAAAAPESAWEVIRPLYFALMSLIGGSSLALGLLGLFVTLTSLRRGDKGTGAVLACVFIIPFAMAAATAEKLAASTGAPTSWHIMGVLIFLTIAAYASHVAGLRKNRSVKGKDRSL